MAVRLVQAPCLFSENTCHFKDFFFPLFLKLSRKQDEPFFLSVHFPNVLMTPSCIQSRDFCKKKNLQHCGDAVYYLVLSLGMNGMDVIGAEIFFFCYCRRNSLS